MLILTRKSGERITIGDKIIISVLAIHGKQVRIGIDAPSSVIVNREEITIKIAAAKKQKLSGAIKKLFGK